MFIITHTKRTSINTDFVKAFEVMKSENKKLCVGAIMNDGKQVVLAEYATEEDCKTAIKILSGAVNFKQPIMFVPSEQQMREAKESRQNGLPPELREELRKLLRGDRQ